MAEDAGGALPSILPTADEISERSQGRDSSVIQNLPNAALQMYPMMYPSVMPGLIPQLGSEQNDHGPGIYAVAVNNPFIGQVASFPPNTLIPISYKIPRRTNSAAVVGGQGQDARQQHGAQRPVVVRRLQFAFHLDLGLLIKLAAVVFLFSQEGSRQQLVLLVFLAMLVYLYQTGVLPPFIRWIRRGGAPPQPRPAVPPENAQPLGPDNGNEPRQEEDHGVDNQNQPPEFENQPAANENQPEPERRNGLNLGLIVREIQTFVIGFITSLLPGYHHND